MVQRVLAAVRSRYGITVFFLYLAAFGVAFVGTFTLPLLAIGMVLAAIFMLVPAVLLGDLVGALSRAANRPYIRRGTCPSCRADQGAAWEGPVYRCAFCGSAFEEDGDPHDGPDTAVREAAVSAAPSGGR